MKREEFEVVSAYDGLSLKGTLFVPNGKVEGLVQIVHGMCECKERYFPIAEHFCSNGLAVGVYDQRGHGDSVSSPEEYGYFGDKTATAIVEDAAQVTEYLKTRFPGVPVTLFGHSMGSMVVRCYLHKHDELIDKLIVCGSPGKNALAGAGKLMAKTIALFKGKMHRSKTLAYLSTGRGNEKFGGEKGSWLTRDKEIVKKFYSDPKCSFIFTCNGFQNLFGLMQKTYKKSLYQVKNPDLRILFVSGSDDAVLYSEKKWKNSQEDLKKVGYQNVSGKLYPEFRHEIHNEIGKEEVYADLTSFIKNV
ncbi:MAG: alpha/beta fold hydrolase [Clostridia bacterium]|nr:alpha/beta fold hydrolase [Clostridia bacterium]